MIMLSTNYLWFCVQKEFAINTVQLYRQTQEENFVIYSKSPYNMEREGWNALKRMICVSRGKTKEGVPAAQLVFILSSCRPRSTNPFKVTVLWISFRGVETKTSSTNCAMHNRSNIPNLEMLLTIKLTQCCRYVLEKVSQLFKEIISL
jgi:hypothetical protein